MTEASEILWNAVNQIESYLRRIPLNQKGTPEELINAAADVMNAVRSYLDQSWIDPSRESVEALTAASHNFVRELGAKFNERQKQDGYDMEGINPFLRRSW